MRLDPGDVTAIVKETARELVDDQVTEMAAAAAFRLILALPPLVIFFAALSSLVDQYTGVDAFATLQQQIREAPLPQQVQDTIQLVLDTARRQGSPGLLSFGILLTLWAASGAIDALMKAFNRAYDTTETRPFVRRRLLALGLTIGLSLLLVAAFVLVVFGQRLGWWLADLAGYGPTFAAVWDVARWPVLVSFVVLALAVLYWAGPAIAHSFRWITPGAIVATLLWLAATWGFSLYLRFAEPGSAYGALGALVVLLFFLYVSSIVLLVGAELNAVVDKRYDPQVVRAKAAHPERQTDAEAARRRAEELAQREGRSRAEVGLEPRPVPLAADERPDERARPAARSGVVAAVLFSLASLFAVRAFRSARRH